MKIIAKKKIYIERERTLTIRRTNGGQLLKFCETCRTESPFVSVDEAAALVGASALQIFRRIEAGKIHFEETVAGSLLVCFASLGREAENNLIKGEI